MWMGPQTIEDRAVMPMWVGHRIREDRTTQDSGILIFAKWPIESLLLGAIRSVNPFYEMEINADWPN